MDVTSPKTVVGAGDFARAGSAGDAKSRLLYPDLCTADGF